MIIDCPYCKTQYEITEEMIGQEAQCVQCNRKFLLGKPTPVLISEYKGAVPSFVSLAADENIVKVAHPLWLNYFWHYFFGGLSLIAAVALFCTHDVETYVFAVLMVFVGLLLPSIAVVNGFLSCYVITDRRIVAKKGLVSVNITEVRIDDIRGVNYFKGVWQAIIGTGNINIGTAATGGVEIKIVGVRQANKLVDQINALRRS